MAHVPDINDFIKGVKIALKSNGVNTFEFPHLCKLIELNQFDTIYHEHFSYLSLFSVEKIFDAFDLRVYKIIKIPTHGGSLRIYGCHRDCAINTDQSVVDVREQEDAAGVTRKSTYFNCESKLNNYRFFTNFKLSNIFILS